jgi:general secretion pathway protein B
MPSLDDIGARRAPWGWIATALSGAVLLLILWRWWSAEPLVDEAALARAPVGGNVAQGSAEPTAAPTPAPTPPVEAAASAPTAPPPAPASTAAPKSSPAAREKAPRSSKPATPPRSSATAATRRRDADDKTQAATPPATAQKAPSATAANAAPRPAAPPAPAPPPERLPKLAELPDDLRRSVPQLAFGGSVYSDTPAQRMVIFNNQVMREGEAITNEVQIEQIRPRSAVLRVRGQRFEMVF